MAAHRRRNCDSHRAGKTAVRPPVARFGLWWVALHPCFGSNSLRLGLLLAMTRPSHLKIGSYHSCLCYSPAHQVAERQRQSEENDGEREFHFVPFN